MASTFSHTALIKSYREAFFFRRKLLKHPYLSFLGLSMDRGLDESASLHKSFLRISATSCVNWTRRLFGKASPINGFDVFLPATV